MTLRLCPTCQQPMTVTDRTPGGSITQYECPNKHVLFIGVHGQVIK